jgi:hypothetical protein
MADISAVLDTPPDAAGEPAGGETGAEQPLTGDEITPDLLGETPPDGEEAEAEETPATGEPPAEKQGEVLPAELSKAIREMKQAHPEQARALKALEKRFYAADAYSRVYPTVDEARTDKAAIEALGGHDAIAGMRQELSNLEQFDRMAEEGNPRVIHGLADQWPDGFKKLVAPALDRLEKLDTDAYVETMRGPFLKIVETNGWLQAMSDAIEYMKAAAGDATTAPVYYKSAEARLNQVIASFNKLKQEETAFKGRYQDPKLAQLETERGRLREEQENIHWQTYTRDVSSYVGSTVRGALTPLTRDMKISEAGIKDLVQGVRLEMTTILQGNKFYMDSIGNLVKSGKTQQAVNFAKAYIDQARKSAVNTVWSRRYGTAQPPAARRPAAAAPRTPTGDVKPAAAASKTPVPITRKPGHDDIDWSKDPGDTLFLQNKAYLKNGRFVTWKEQP